MTDTSELCGAKTQRGYNQTTASGKPFWSTDPRPEDVRIEDIAAQLSRVCRFGGALKDGGWADLGVPEGCAARLKRSPTLNIGCVWVDYETYSVAQHSVIVADNVPEPYRLRALLHDAAEAYVGDMVKPVKMAMSFDPDDLYLYLWEALGEDDEQASVMFDSLNNWAPNFKLLEHRVQCAILTRFGLPEIDEEADAAIAIADYRAVLTEHRDLQEPSPEVDWGTPQHPPFEGRIIPLLPSAARELFLRRFNELYKGE